MAKLIGRRIFPALKHLQADVLALDFLEKRDGSYIVLESNDVPGFSGFPDAVRVAVAACLRVRLEEESSEK